MTQRPVPIPAAVLPTLVAREDTSTTRTITAAGESLAEDIAFDVSDGVQVSEALSAAQRDALAALPPKQELSVTVPAGWTLNAFAAPTPAAVAEYIRRHDARRIVVMAGAGISVAAGISDFRTPVTGLYANLGKYELEEPQDLFTMETLEETPDIFYRVCEDMKLWPGAHRPTAMHHLVALLAEESRLQRFYTQNIDGLERLAGLDPELLVEAHGTFATARCTGELCRKVHDVGVARLIFAETGHAPRCEDCGSVVKPDVVFFGERLPERFHEHLHEDFEACDLLIVAGTSLEVHPFAGLHALPGPCVPRVLLNMHRVGEFAGPARVAVDTDTFIGGDCQDAAAAIAESLGLQDKFRAKFL